MSIFCDFQLNILCTLLKQSCLTGLECVGHIKLKRTQKKSPEPELFSMLTGGDDANFQT